jgi:hypothetical protein
MRSQFQKAVKGGAVVALVLAVCLVAAGCEMFDDSCGCKPTCAAPAPAPCGCAAPQPTCAGNCGAFPAEAKPGEAWCCVWVPPVMATEKEKICTCPEQCNKIWVPPVYETRKKQVCTKEACSVQIPIPAEYATVEECVEVCAARTEWQRVDCATEGCKAGEKQGECWALVTIPPTYEKRCKQVCTKEASCRTETTPPVYEEQCEQVETACGYYRDETIPAKYEEREKQVCTAEGRWEWRKNMTCVVPQPQVCNPCTPGATAPAPAPMPATSGGSTPPAPAPTPEQPK